MQRKSQTQALEHEMLKKLAVYTLTAAFLGGCSSAPPKLHLKDTGDMIEEGTILSGSTGQAIEYEGLIAELAAVRVVYIGEMHTDRSHHEIQLRIVESLKEEWQNMRIAMEMFAYTYQDVLDRWSAGELDRESFLEKTQWYANWRFDFSLYEDILNFARDENIPIAALNIPFHIPAKVRVGGIENLLNIDKAFLPETVDTTNEAHRSHTEPIFNHHRFSETARFAFFYEAQCVWEDTMAESISRNLNEEPMVVLVGNGHIIYKFGVPDRAFRRTQAEFKTVYLAPAGSEVKLDYADYIWVTPAGSER